MSNMSQRSNPSMGTKNTRCTLVKDSMIGIYLYPDQYFTLNEWVELIDLAEKLMAGRRLPLLLDKRDIAGISREVLDYCTGDRVKDVTPAMACLIDSLTSCIIKNIYLAFKKLPIPIRFFVSEEKAKNWLLPFSHEKISSDT